MGCQGGGCLTSRRVGIVLRPSSAFLGMVPLFIWVSSVGRAPRGRNANLRRTLGCAAGTLVGDRRISSSGFGRGRGRGSHRVFAREGLAGLVNLQEERGQAKHYQVRQIATLVRRYDLSPGGGAVSGYPIEVFWSDDEVWIADVPDMEYCTAHGATPHEAVAEVELAIEAWLEAARRTGRAIPNPVSSGDSRLRGHPPRLIGCPWRMTGRFALWEAGTTDRSPRRWAFRCVPRVVDDRAGGRTDHKQTTSARTLVDVTGRSGPLSLGF
jgi:predicted RNase H-like HicB family nuclease